MSTKTDENQTKTTTYTKRIEFEPYGVTIAEILNGLTKLVKNHATTLNDLHIHVDQFDDGANADIRLTLQFNPDADPGDEPTLSANERRERFLDIDEGDEFSTENDWTLVNDGGD
jgi:hypothetical protein